MKSGSPAAPLTVTRTTARTTVMEATGSARMTAGLDANVPPEALLALVPLAWHELSALRRTIPMVRMATATTATTVTTVTMPTTATLAFPTVRACTGDKF